MANNIFCIECGFELPSTAKFCKKCGVQIEASESPSESDTETNEDKPFVNWTRVWKLHNGAIWQLYKKMERLEEENKSLKENLSKMLTEG